MHKNVIMKWLMPSESVTIPHDLCAHIIHGRWFMVNTRRNIINRNENRLWLSIFFFGTIGDFIEVFWIFLNGKRNQCLQMQFAAINYESKLLLLICFDIFSKNCWNFPRFSVSRSKHRVSSIAKYHFWNAKNIVSFSIIIQLQLYSIS